MKPIEELIIKNLVESDKLDDDTERALMKLAQEEPFGTSSLEFIKHPALDDYISKIYGDKKNYFVLWLRIEDYLRNKSDVTLAQEKLSHIEEALQKCLRKITPQTKARGTAILPIEIANAQFMRNIYSIEDEELSKLFLKYLPAPRANLFKKQAIPAMIKAREQDSTQVIRSFLKKNDNNLALTEEKIIKIQRAYRARKRKQENLQRLPNRYADLWRSDDGAAADKDGEKFARKLLADANKPYKPKCEEGLAIRIMEAAKKVELFSTVSHLTAATALESIFNDGLYGRRSMMQFYMPFRPASLWQSDIREGDANVVCLGANAIDPKAKHGIKLRFDAKKIAENNPCVFFKQRDLGFDLEKIRHVMIGDLYLKFSHTSTYRLQPEEVSSLVLSIDGCDQHTLSDVTKALLIADNINEMHQILTLNFFRFIDGLMNYDSSKNTHSREKIYAALSKLSDDQLIATLLQIGKNMTDTMEFNFYGAYKIDFSAILTIQNDNPPYILDLPRFIDELKAGNIEMLNEAMVKLPTIFNSYRFIDHLLSNTNNETVIASLQIQKEKCTLPAWMEEENNSLKPM